MLNASETTYLHNLLQQDVEKLYGLHEMAELRILASTKDVQIALLVVSVIKWKKMFRATISQPSASFYKQFFANIIASDFLPRLESYYKTEIKHYYVFNPKILDDIVYFYTVKYFNAPVSSFANTIHRSIEETTVNKISRLIKNLYGRGPEQVTVTIPNDRLILICIKGLLVPFVKEYCENNYDACLLMQELLKTMMLQVLNTFCQAEYGFIPETFVETDIKYNCIVALTVIVPVHDFL